MGRPFANKTYNFAHFVPKIGSGVFIAPSAIVLGRVTMGDHSNIWFNSVARADVNEIIIGRNTNVQDISMLHVTEKNRLYIGHNVSIGHSVTLHGCTIGDSCLIGMGAVILDGAEIGENSLVAAGSLVTPGKKFPPKSLIKGRPAVVERPLTAEEQKLYGNHYLSYVEYKDQYLTDPAFLASLN